MAREEAGRGPRVAYLVNLYPALSHAFIQTEIVALRGLGAEVHTFSIHPPRPEELLSRRDQEEADRCTVLLDRVASSLARGLLSLLRRRPAALPAALRQAVTTGPRSLRGRLWQLFYLAEAVLLWEQMRRRGLRHVHVHFANNGADVARLVVALGRAVDGPDAGWRWSLTMHGPTEFEDQSRFDLAAKLASAHAVACISDYCRSQVMRLLPPQHWDKLAVVRMGVDAQRYRPADGPPGGNGRLRVLTVGRLVPEKGATLLVDAIARLVRAGTPVHLTVVGAGPLAESLAQQVQREGLEDVVRLAGPLGQDDLPDVYRGADVFCLPSFAEGLPVVIMEAMASGLPVVTTAIAGVPELVVDHRTGLLVLPGRVDLLAEALTMLADDRRLVAALGGQARRGVVARHDPPTNAGRLMELFGADGPAVDQGLP